MNSKALELLGLELETQEVAVVYDEGMKGKSAPLSKGDEAKDSEEKDTEFLPDLDEERFLGGRR
jgi:hypothetical protein